MRSLLLEKNSSLYSEVCHALVRHKQAPGLFRRKRERREPWVIPFYWDSHVKEWMNLHNRACYWLIRIT